MATSLRRYEHRDLDALYDVCLRTGHAGRDATSVVHEPRLLGDLFAAPYAHLEPELVTVVEDGEGVGGYIVGTADSAAFADRCEAEWWPAVRQRYPEGSGGSGLGGLFVALVHHPVNHDPRVVATHPAHLHIDLLPRLQGRGLGRQLMDRFCTAVAARGAAGVHFGVSAQNVPALGFYGHLGFEPLRDDGYQVTMGKRLA